MRMTELENYYRKVEISCQIATFNEIFHALRINAKKSIDKRNGTKSRKKKNLAYFGKQIATIK